jgi:RNA polymerase sigma-70 factor (ECF subfamily)
MSGEALRPVTIWRHRKAEPRALEEKHQLKCHIELPRTRSSRKDPGAMSPPLVDQETQAHASQTPEWTEQEIRTAWEQRNYRLAATLLVDAYGPEILGFLAAWMNGRSRAAEAFSMFMEDLWVGLPGFRWQCTARGWAYTLARNAARRYARAERRRSRLEPLPDDTVSALIARVHTRTAPYLNTAVKDRMRSLRQRLSPDDQSLLILRVNRQLPWTELAIVLSDDGLRASDQDLARQATRLRKRFQFVKARLKKLARAEGLID